MLEDIVNQGGCSIPWLHTEINLQTNQVKPCCKYSSPVGSAEENFLHVWNNADYTALRTDMGNGILPAECSACAVPAGTFSYKEFKNSAYKFMLRIVPATPSVFHFTLKNTCNLACRMCHPTVSSRLASVSDQSPYLKQFYNIKPVDNKFDLTKLKGSFKEAQILTIGGGEPLIDEDCISLIDMVATESPKFRQINFSTNMTKINQRLIDLLNTLPVKVNFNVSIDGPAHIHNYIRYGCDWNQIVANLKFLRKNYRFNYGINSTVSALNVGYLGEMLDAIILLEQQTGIKFTHLMSSPVLEDHLHAGVLPTEVKALYSIKLNSVECKNKDSAELVQTGLRLLQEDRHINWQRFLEFTDAFDAVADTTLASVYPELAYRQGFEPRTAGFGDQNSAS